MRATRELQYAERLGSMDERHRKGMLRVFDRILALLENKHGKEPVRRVRHCIDILRGEVDATIQDPRQAPSVIFFPGLTAQPWHDPAAFPWFEVLESNAGVVQSELSALFEAPHAFHQEDSPTYDGPQEGWSVALLDQHGRRHRENIRRCARTMELIDRHVPHSLRECQFSRFEPGTHVQEHHGVANVILTCHLCLFTPETGAGMKVGGEVKWQSEGRGLIFDDTFLHEAWNHGDSPRTILMWDVWHPELTAVEIESLKALFPAFEKYLLQNTSAFEVANGSVYVRAN